MTYLQLVNEVLARLREDQVLTVQGSDDVVVNLVKSFVNDAKRTVEDAHSWQALSKEWVVSLTPGTSSYVLTNSARSAIIDHVYDSSGNELLQTTRAYVHKRTLQGGSANKSRYYILDGVDTNGDLKIQLWPTPDTADTLHVFGFQPTTELSADTDRLLVPSQPVIYYAEAMAGRERGEVGGQSAGELLTLAGQYLRDAIAKDATNSDPENIWTTV